MHHAARRRRRLWRRLRRDLCATLPPSVAGEVVPDFIMTLSGLTYVAGGGDDATH